jgi:endonuclease G
MLKKFLFLLALIPVIAVASQRAPLPAAGCAEQLFYGEPQITKSDTRLICRQGYATLNDLQAKIPVWTAWVLTPAHVNGCVKRSNKFAADQSIPPADQAKPSDYAHSGYDKGHIANDDQQSWDPIVESESFLMTNMTPQLPGLNRGIWKVLETATSAWAFDTGHPLEIYAGPIYQWGKDKTIGEDHIDVPTAFYKIVIDTKTGSVLAFEFPNKAGQGSNINVGETTVSEIESQTGIVFPLPKGSVTTSKVTVWPIDLKPMTANKKQVCHK